MGRERASQPRARRRALGSAAETWQVARVRLRAWVREPGEEPRRPWLSIVGAAPSGLVLGSNLTVEKPSPGDVLALVEQTMAHPLVGRPRRPDRLVCPEPELGEALASPLLARGVPCGLGETPELWEVVGSLEEHLRGGPLLPGLLDSPDVTPEQVGRLFAAAADFYRRAPWRFLSDEQPIAIRCPAESAAPRYVVVMGRGGLEFGLACYRSLEQLAAIYSGAPPEALIGTFDQESITFGRLEELAFADLDGLEWYGWEVAGPGAYPLPLVYTKEGEVRRPSAEDLRWYEAALRAVPRFAAEHLRAVGGLSRPVEATLSVAVGSGEVAVGLRYPPEGFERVRRRRRRR